MPAPIPSDATRHHRRLNRVLRWMGGLASAGFVVVGAGLAWLFFSVEFEGDAATQRAPVALAMASLALPWLGVAVLGLRRLRVTLGLPILFEAYAIHLHTRWAAGEDPLGLGGLLMGALLLSTPLRLGFLLLTLVGLYSWSMIWRSALRNSRDQL